ncbi:hypothetical protein [Neobacillus bataviensis]|uniref:hypothetical protein n=1 Tax=Neobacillus bataviensis TaxID=220685 RepID=UPI001CBD072A|nr:hypothetical protein [Neobacillus bataviensis]
MNISELLGLRFPYDNLIEARVDKSPDELVVSDNGRTFYIVSRELSDKLKPHGYEIVVTDGE